MAYSSSNQNFQNPSAPVLTFCIVLFLLQLHCGLQKTFAKSRASDKSACNQNTLKSDNQQKPDNPLYTLYTTLYTPVKSAAEPLRKTKSRASVNRTDFVEKHMRTRISEQRFRNRRSPKSLPNLFLVFVRIRVEYQTQVLADIGPFFSQLQILS